MYVMFLDFHKLQVNFFQLLIFFNCSVVLVPIFEKQTVVNTTIFRLHPLSTRTSAINFIYPSISASAEYKGTNVRFWFNDILNFQSINE